MKPQEELRLFKMFTAQGFAPHTALLLINASGAPAPPAKRPAPLWAPGLLTSVAANGTLLLRNHEKFGETLPCNRDAPNLRSADPGAGFGPATSAGVS